jgi:hypothetical protein
MVRDFLRGYGEEKIDGRARCRYGMIIGRTSRLIECSVCTINLLNGRGDRRFLAFLD